MKFRNKDLGVHNSETFIIIIINFISFLKQGSKWGRKEVVRLRGDFKWYVQKVKVLILILLSINYKGQISQRTKMYENGSFGEIM